MMLRLISAAWLACILGCQPQPADLSPEAEARIRQIVQEELTAHLERASETDPLSEDAIREAMRASISEALAGFMDNPEDLQEAMLRDYAAARGQIQKQENADRLVNTAMRVASDLQAWKRKPAAFGGGSNVEGFTGVQLQNLGYSVNEDGLFETPDGQFSLQVADDGASVTIRGQNDHHENAVVVTVSGTMVEDIQTQIVTSGS